MLTLNQIKKILKDYFNAHALINSVYYMDDFNFNAERSIDYPVANIEYVNSDINIGVMNHNYKIVIADLCELDNAEMEDNIHSDSLQIAEDFFTYLQNYEGLIFKKTSSINHFTEDTGDLAAGIVFTVQLGTIRKQNWCDSPTK